MQRFKLKNGLIVIYDKRPGNSFVVNATVKVGSNHETSSERGLSHFLEHILFEGTKHFSTRALANEIEKVGGELNAATSNERTFYYAIVPNNHFENALKVISEIIIHPIFDAKAIEKERQVIISEIKMINDDPKHLQWILLEKLMFDKNNARFPVYGSEESIRRLTRQQIINYYKKHYVSNNIVLSIVGNVKNIKKVVSKYFSSSKPSTLVPYTKVEEPLQSSIRQSIVSKNTEHSYLTIGYKAPPLGKKDSYAFEVIEAILGRGQSSRLFDEIRIKRGLAYSVGAIYESNIDFGFFAIYLNTDKSNLEKCKSLVLDQFQLKNLTNQEIKEAKDYIEGSFLIKTSEHREKAEKNAFFQLLGQTEQEYLANIRKVTLKDVKDVVKHYFKANYSLITIKQKL